MNDIHPTAVLGDDVKLGTGNVIGPYAVIIGPCQIGDDNWIGPHVSIGGPPEIRGIAHLAAWHDAGDGPGVRIGDRNVLREFTCVHQPSGHHPTTIGDDCYIMNKVYIPHDATICDAVTIASSVAMGGHVRIGAGANLGLGSNVHQRRVVGPGVMLGMGSVVTRNVPPFAMAFGNPARVRGANETGMRRAGLAPASVEFVTARYARGETELDPRAVPADLADAFSWWREQTAAAH